MLPTTPYRMMNNREEGENRTREPEGLGPEPSAFDRFATSPKIKGQAQGGDRTHDLQINSLSHYRLCYSSQRIKIKNKTLPRRELNPGLNGDSVTY